MYYYDVNNKYYYDVNNNLLEVESVEDDYCPECGSELGDVYFIPAWCVKRCGDCLHSEAIKFGYNFK